MHSILNGVLPMAGISVSLFLLNILHIIHLRVALDFFTAVVSWKFKFSL